MRTLVLGGIRSGKSGWAERAITEAAPAAAPVRYLATGQIADADPAWATRISRHQLRRPAHWQTVETTDVATELGENPGAPTMVDDIGMWLTSALDRRGAFEAGSAVNNAYAADAVAADADALVAAIERYDAPLVLVSPEVGLTVVPATPAGRIFADALGALNQRLAHVADRVVLVVAGQPLHIKGDRM